jgi:hypothetical protein
VKRANQKTVIPNMLPQKCQRQASVPQQAKDELAQWMEKYLFKARTNKYKHVILDMVEGVSAVLLKTVLAAELQQTSTCESMVSRKPVERQPALVASSVADSPNSRKKVQTPQERTVPHGVQERMFPLDENVAVHVQRKKNKLRSVWALPCFAVHLFLISMLLPALCAGGHLYPLMSTGPNAVKGSTAFEGGSLVIPLNLGSCVFAANRLSLGVPGPAELKPGDDVLCWRTTEGTMLDAGTIIEAHFMEDGIVCQHAIQKAAGGRVYEIPVNRIVVSKQDLTNSYEFVHSSVPGPDDYAATPFFDVCSDVPSRAQRGV